MALRQRLALHRWRDACAGQADRAGAVHHPGREAAIENGMAEAFVKTFERDYAWVRPRPDAATIIAQLADWFEQYQHRSSAQVARLSITARVPRFGEKWRDRITARCPRTGSSQARKPREASGLTRARRGPLVRTTSCPVIRGQLQGRVKPAQPRAARRREASGLTRARPWTTRKNHALSGYSGQLQRDPWAPLRSPSSMRGERAVVSQPPSPKNRR